MHKTVGGLPHVQGHIGSHPEYIPLLLRWKIIQIQLKKQVKICSNLLYGDPWVFTVWLSKLESFFPSGDLSLCRFIDKIDNFALRTMKIFIHYSLKKKVFHFVTIVLEMYFYV